VEECTTPNNSGDYAQVYVTEYSGTPLGNVDKNTSHDLGNFSSGEKISEITPESSGREISTTPEFSAMEMSNSSLGNISADPPPECVPKKKGSVVLSQCQ